LTQHTEGGKLMLAPDYYYDSVYMVPYNELWQKNIRALIFDLDNTLASYDVIRPTAKVVSLMKRLQRIGFKICLLTNNTEKRVSTYNESLNLVAIHGALKPFTPGINRALRAMNADRSQTAIIGDQLFSDIWAGRNARITTIMVKPVSQKDIITVIWKRIPERLFMKSYFKKIDKK
jgi:hypothetical protein